MVIDDKNVAFIDYLEEDMILKDYSVSVYVQKTQRVMPYWI